MKKADLDKMRRTREKVCGEIVSSERAYVNSLSNLQTHFLQPLREKKSVIKTEDHAKIFNNIEEILQFHMQLLVELQNSKQNIHKPFKKTGLLLKMYTSYVNGYNKAIGAIHENEKNSRFQRFLDNALINSGTGLGLMAYLIMPVQRIPRYALLLKEVIKNTDPTHVAELNSLRHSLQNIEGIATRINERKRKVDNQLSVLAIQSKLGKSLANQGFELYHPGRWFVHEGRCNEFKLNSKHVKERYLVIFSDMVLWATYPQYKYKGCRALAESKITRVKISDPRSSGREIEGFQLKYGPDDRDPTVFFCDTANEADGYVMRLLEARSKYSTSKSNSAKSSRRSSITPRAPKPPPPPVTRRRQSVSNSASPVSSTTLSPSTSINSTRGLVRAPSERHGRMKSLWGGCEQIGLLTSVVNRPRYSPNVSPNSRGGRNNSASQSSRPQPSPLKHMRKGHRRSGAI